MAKNLNEKNYFNVYFIENHLKGIELKLYFKDDEKQLYDSLKNEYRFEFNIQKNEIYDVSVYSFKVYKEHLNEIKLKPKKYVKIILETQGKDKYETKINVSEFEERRNCFAFNTKFESCKKLFGIDLNTAPKALNLDDDQSFDIYLKFLKNSPNEEGNKIHDDLIYYTIFHFDKKKENMTYYFLADIFVECYLSKDHRRRLLDLYRKDKFDLSNIGNLKVKIPDISKKIKICIEKDIKDIFNDEDNNNKTKMTSFLFYFNYYYQKEIIDKMIEVKEIKSYVYDILIKDKFSDLKLNKNSIKNLIKSSNNFEYLNIILTYNNNFLDLLEVINEESQFIKIVTFNLSIGAKNKNNNKYIIFIYIWSSKLFTTP